MTIDHVIREYITANPQIYVAKIIHNNQEMWVKRRPVSKRNMWHKLLQCLSYIIPLPIIYPTVVSDPCNSLLKEAERLTLFNQNNIPVSAVVTVKPEYLVTSDVGITLQNQLHSATDTTTRNNLLEQAVSALGQLHQANFCHGRPSLRDITYKNEQVFFIDLEEDPLRVMNLAQAQARDIWLLFVSIARQYQDEPQMLKDLFTYSLSYANTETRAALKQMVIFLKPIRWFVQYFLFAIKSKDLHAAASANKIMEQSFKYLSINDSGKNYNPI